MTVTLADIAKEVGTSVNTVSRALRDCSDIGSATKERVKRVAAEMGYVPNKIAEFLRSKRSNIVSVLIASLTNPFYSICIEYMLDYMTEHGYRALITVKKKNLRVETDDIVQCIQNGACGIVSFLDISDEGIEYCKRNNIPFLLCGKTPQVERVNAIYMDDRACGTLVARAAKTAKRPCYVANRVREFNLDDRGNGFIDALKEDGKDCEVYYYDYYARRESQKSIVSAILENGNDFIFCYNDEIALTVLEVLKGIKDIPIYGVDRLGEYLSYCSGIGSVGANIGFIGKRCAQLILQAVEQGDGKVIKELLPIGLNR